MDYVVKLNGVDITKKINIIKCITTDRLGGISDDIQMKLPYQGEVSFDKDDELELIADTYSTGIMYIDECESTEDKTAVVIKAVSYKHKNKKVKSRAWYNVTLNQLADDVAKNCGLTAKMYGTVNYTYKSIFQHNESDVGFLARICSREGYSVKCSGQNLIIFNDYFLEHEQEPLKLNAEDITKAHLKAKTNCLSEFTVTHYDLEDNQLYSYTAKDENIDGRTAKSVEVVSNQAEAERFAKGYLRSVNNSYITGQMISDFKADISAGTVIELSGFDNFDGKYIAFEVSHDIVSEKTYFKIRNTLDY